VSGAAAAVTYAGITNIAATVLANVKNNNQSNLTWLWTPKAWAKLHQFPEFTNSQYVSDAKLAGQTVEARNWIFGTHMHMPDLPNATTNTARCFVFHKNGIGHAYDGSAPRINVGNDEEDQYDYVSAVVLHASRLLQAGGVWRVDHDDTA
jgi:hypothetical protein